MSPLLNQYHYYYYYYYYLSSLLIFQYYDNYSSKGKPPGTSMNRPGSGIGGGLRPGSGRLRTGAPAGPGTQAAQGYAIQASVNVSDRPGLLSLLFLVSRFNSLASLNLYCFIIIYHSLFIYLLYLSLIYSFLSFSVTGQGMMGMKPIGQTGRLVEDTAYYIGLLKKRIQDVNTESQRMRTEMDQSSKENSQNALLEKKYEKLIKNKEQVR